MRKLRLLGVFCACLLPFVFGNTSHAEIYLYTGNDFDMNDESYPLCLLGGQACFTSITATIELSAPLGNNLDLQAIMPAAWSISDGLTTITDTNTEFNLFLLEVGTDGSGNIIQWNFSVDRNNTQPLNELSFMRTTSDAGIETVDDTSYCTRFSVDGVCDYTARAFVDVTPGTWIMTTVPLPAAVWLLGSGLLALLGVARSRKAA